MWPAATDDDAITAYRVYQDGVQLEMTDGATFSLDVEGLVPEEEYLFKVEAGDADDQWTTDGPMANYVAELPDPMDTAPALDTTAATSLFEAVSFFFEGESPIQVGVADGTIEANQLTWIRGRVLNEDGAGLPFVRVGAIHHPEFGYTVTGEDGSFNYVVNGGQTYSLALTRDGYISAHRGVAASWEEMTSIADVVLVAFDEEVTSISFGGGTAMQVAQGSTETDDSGTRRATLLFPAGTMADIRLPDGTTVATSTLSVRITEFTVGDDGPARMPASLPAVSAYTYAVELSADEAIAMDAVRVEFDRDVILYAENFRSFPVGTAIPVGYYDVDRGLWVPEEDGLVIEILSETGGLADLDLDGGGMAATSGELSMLGVSDDERAQLATLYAPGQTLQRIPRSHFSSFDPNFVMQPLCGMSQCEGYNGTPDPNTPVDQTTCEGSIVDLFCKSLGELFPILGTDFSLNYRSRRAFGNVTSHSLRVPLIGDDVPSGLQAIRVFASGPFGTRGAVLAPTADATYAIDWDGRDPFGRRMNGAQRVDLQVGFDYASGYVEGLDAVRAFGWYTSTQARTGGGSRSFTMSSIGDAPPTFTFWSRQDSAIGVLDARDEIGGWTLSAHHMYDPVASVLHLGNGEVIDRSTFSRRIFTAAGTGQASMAVVDGPALTTPIYPLRMAAAPNGDVYFTEQGFSATIRRLTRDGMLTTLAFDSGLPRSPYLLAFSPDGLLHVLASGDNCGFVDQLGMTVSRLERDGTWTTVIGAQSCVPPPGGGVVFSDLAPADGELATSGPFGGARLLDFAIGPDGDYFITGELPPGTGNVEIRRIGPDGVIRRLGGGGVLAPLDGMDPRFAQLPFITDIETDPNGNLYLFTGRQFFSIDSDNILRFIAGTTAASAVEFGPAADVNFYRYVNSALRAFSVAENGTIFAANDRNTGDGFLCILTVTAERVEPLAGECTNTNNSSLLDGEQALRAEISTADLVLSPDGTLFNSGSARIRRITAPTLASLVGNEVFEFDARGRHLQTRDARSGIEKYAFDYDEAGRLIAVLDRYENVTTIERDVAGAPTAIVGPDGARTTLTLDEEGNLATVTNPDGETIEFEYEAGGMLVEMRDARDGVHAHDYNAVSELISDEGAGGISRTIARSRGYNGDLDASFNVEGRTTTIDRARNALGELVSTMTSPSGAVTTTTVQADSGTLTTYPDGSTLATESIPNAYTGAATAGTTVFQTPLGWQLQTSTTQVANYEDLGDPSRVTSYTTTATINSKTSTSIYDVDDETLSFTSDVGREIDLTLDGDRIESIAVEGLAPIAIGYDARGRPTSATQSGRSATLSYGTSGWIDSVTDGAGRTTSFARDANGRIETMTSPEGREITFAYDGNGNIASVTPPTRPNHGHTYTPFDAIASYEPPDVAGDGTRITTYAYTPAGEIDLITRPDGATIDFGYDAGGRLNSIAASTGTTTLTYAGTTRRVASLANTDGNSLAFTYDGPLIASMTWDGDIDGSVTATYGNDLLITQLQVNAANPITYTFDDDGYLLTAGAMTYVPDAAHGMIVSADTTSTDAAYAYNTFGELASFSLTASSMPIYSYSLTRDTNGRITGRTETIQGAMSVYAYGHDNDGRLTSVTVNAGTPVLYTYDDNGNRLTRSGGESAAYDEQDRLVTYTTAAGTTTFAYTANGELMSKTRVMGMTMETTSYVYDPVGNLRGVTLPGGDVIAYEIDPTHRRIGKRVNGALEQGFLYENDLRIAAELNGAGAVVSRFVYGYGVNVPDLMIQGGTTYRLVTDHLGSVRLVVNAANGAVAQRIDYDEWGRVTSDSNPGFQPFGFAGGLYDPDTGLVRFGARDYDPQTGRWTSKDPIRFEGGDANLYGYVLASPVQWIDPRGFHWITPTGGGGGFWDRISRWVKGDPPKVDPTKPSTGGNNRGNGQGGSNNGRGGGQRQPGYDPCDRYEGPRTTDPKPDSRTVEFTALDWLLAAALAAALAVATGGGLSGPTTVSPGAGGVVLGAGGGIDPGGLY